MEKSFHVFLPPRTPLFKVDRQGAELHGRNRKPPPLPKETILHHLPDRMKTGRILSTLKKGVRGRSMPMPQSSLITAIVQGGAVLFPSTVVLIPLLLFNMMEPHRDDCFCQTCALHARSYVGAVHSQSNEHNILSAIIIVPRNFVVLLSVCSPSFLNIGVMIAPAPCVPDGFV